MVEKNENRLKELRKEANLKQSELAEIIGTSQQNISKYERDDYSSVDPKIEEAIASYFSCSIDYLRGISNIKNPENLLEKEILLKHEFQKLGIIGKDEDLSDELLSYFRDLINANKPFLSKIAELRKKNLSEDTEKNDTDADNK